MLLTRIQTLRAIAVGAVILNHFGAFGSRAGFFGVDLFFVISGFVITKQLLTNHGLANFYKKRVARILPASITVLLFSLLVWILFIGKSRAVELAQSLPSISMMLANKFYYQTYTDYFQLGSGTSPFLHYWSLAVEEQFYLILPVLLLLTKKLSNKLTLSLLLTLTSISYIYFFSLSSTNPTLAFYSPLSRAWELLLGVILAYLVKDKSNSVSRKLSSLAWSLLLAIFAGLTFVVTSTNVITLTVMVLLSALLVYLASYQPVKTGYLTKFSIFLGNISYSLYLIHFPLFIFFVSKTGKAPSLTQALLLVLLTVLLSTLMHYAIEKPARYWLNKRARPTLPFALLIISVIVCLIIPKVYKIESATKSTAIVSLSTQLNIDLARALEPDYRPVTLYPELSNLRAELDLVDGVGQCVDGATICSTDFDAKERTVLLFGDSHATMWWSSLYHASKKYNFNAILFSKGGCPPALIKYAEWHNNPPPIEKYNECKEWFISSIEKIKKINPDVLIVTGSGTTSQWAENLPLTFDQFDSLLSKKILLADFPYPIPNILDCYSVNSEDVTKCQSIKSKSIITSQRNLEIQATRDSAWSLVLPDQLFCLEEKCPAVVNGLYVYRDQWHVTRTYGKMIALDFAKLLALNTGNSK